jgi:hypothetical protein
MAQEISELARQFNEDFNAFMRGQITGEEYAAAFDPEIEVVWHEQRTYPDFPQRLRDHSETGHPNVFRGVARAVGRDNRGGARGVRGAGLSGPEPRA